MGTYQSIKKENAKLPFPPIPPKTLFEDRKNQSDDIFTFLENEWKDYIARDELYQDRFEKYDPEAMAELRRKHHRREITELVKPKSDRITKELETFEILQLLEKILHQINFVRLSIDYLSIPIASKIKQLVVFFPPKVRARLLTSKNNRSKKN